MKYEIKKILGSRVLIIALILAVGFALFESNRNYIQGLDEGRERINSGVYDAYKGEYSEEKYQNLLEKTNQLQEEFALLGEKKADNRMLDYMALYEVAENCRTTQLFLEQVVDEARYLAQTQSGYYKKLNQKTEQVYKNCRPDLHIDEISSVQNILLYFELPEEIDVAFVLVLMIFACTIFLNEHINHTFYMIQSSKTGRGHTYFCKIGLSLIFACMLSVLQTISITIVPAIRSGMGKLGYPIQMSHNLMYSPYNLNFWQLVIVLTLLRAIGYMTLVLLFLCATLFFKKNIVPFAINLFLGGGGMFLTYMASGRFYRDARYGVARTFGGFIYLKKYSPFTMISEGMNYIGKFEMVNVLGQPVSLLQHVMVINLIIIAFLTVAGYLAYTQNFRRMGVSM